MRIIGGEAKGRTISLPKGCRIRPTTDRIKESLFALLASLQGVRFLDLYAGCGNVGLEALSRGAAKALFVEKSRRLAEAIDRNLTLLGFADRGEVLALDAESAIRLLGRRGDRYDLVFADPPYEEGGVSAVQRTLLKTDLLAVEGTIVLQHSVREPLAGDTAGRWRLRDQRRYGDTLLSFLRPAEGNERENEAV